jgi:GWxTD domain-containing protein
MKLQMTRSWRRPTRRFLVSVFVALLSAVPASAATLPELFQKAKEQVRFGSFEKALASLQEVEALSQRSGLEKDRVALVPALAFYRGVCYASLDRPEQAREEFSAFLETTPNAALDPAAYSRKAVSAFEQARTSLREPQKSGANPTSAIADAYTAFRRGDEVPREDLGDEWAQGPVRFLMTASEKQEFERLTDSVSRAEFIENFWRSRDPKGETPENEFRDEFERRVAFSDQWFVQGETRGSDTDRGTVFVLMGPPSHDGTRPMKTGEDTADPAALFRYTPGQIRIAAAPGGSRSDQISRIDAVTGPGTSVQSASANWREVWRYERKNLPAGLPYSSVDLLFISKPGYGDGVLQRNPQALQALERAKANVPRPGEP